MMFWWLYRGSKSLTSPAGTTSTAHNRQIFQPTCRSGVLYGSSTPPTRRNNPDGVCAIPYVSCGIIVVPASKLADSQVGFYKNVVLLWRLMECKESVLVF